MTPGPEPTIRDLFETSLAAETIGRDFYLRLSQAFAHQPEVGTFWYSLARDEGQHIAALRRIRDRLTQAQLEAPVNPGVMLKGESIFDILDESRIACVATLDDAYHLALEYENSELNRLFTFLATRYVTRGDRETFVVRELLDHQAKLVEFPRRFGGQAWRSRMLAFDGETRDAMAG